MKRRILSALLVLCMVLACLPATAFAAETEGTCGDNLTWTYDETTATLTISGEGAMNNYVVNPEYVATMVYVPWDDYRDSVRYVVIEDGVTSIGNEAFFGHSALVGVSISDTVESIGQNAFRGCADLESINLPRNLTEISDYMFYECSSIVNIEIPSSVSVIGNFAFYKCSSLERIVLPGGVTKVGAAAFNDCTSLKEIVFEGNAPRFGYSSTTEIFYGVTASVYYPAGNTTWNSNVLRYHGGDLTLIPIAAEFGTWGENIEWTFDAATGTLSFTGEGTMEAASYNEYPWYGHYQNVKKVIIGDGITNVADYAFQGYENLNEAIIGNSVTEIGSSAFYWCTNLYSVSIPDSMKVFWHQCFYNTAISEMYIPDGVTTIHNGAFGHTSLVDVVIPDSVVELGSSVFNGCTELVSVVMGNGITEMGFDVFDGCTSLENVTLSENLTSLGMYAFANCTSLETVVLPESVDHIGMSAFDNSGLRYIVIPANVTAINNAFYKATELRQIVFTGDYVDGLFVSNSFDNVTAKAYYPAGNETWTDDVLLDYGGDITWIPYTELPEPPIPNPFDDVIWNTYYYDPVLWAVENGITTGLTPTTFGVDETCTRAQVVTFLWRAAVSPAPTSDVNPFTDVEANQFYSEAVLWAVEQGITTGLNETTFGVNDPCTREQVVTFLCRYAGGSAPEGAVNPFDDVEQNQFYTDAALWAVEKGITTGLNATTFGIGSPCSRAMVVTFLYRAQK